MTSEIDKPVSAQTCLSYKIYIYIPYALRCCPELLLVISFISSKKYTIGISIVKRIDVKNNKLFGYSFKKRVRNIFCVEEESPLQTKIKPKIIVLVIPKRLLLFGF